MKLSQSKKLRFWVLALGLISATFIADVAPVFAAGADSGHGSPGLDTLFKPAINFFFYLVAVVFIYRKLGAPALLKRHQLIKNELERAAIDLNQAERELEGIAKRLAGIEDERADLLQRYEGEGQQLSESILRNAGVMAERTVQDVKRQIESEIKQANKLLQRESVFLATELAKKKLQSEFLPEEDKRIRQQVLQDLSN